MIDNFYLFFNNWNTLRKIIMQAYLARQFINLTVCDCLCCLKLLLCFFLP
nr:MAG TPA: hypothetical protein [Caudoviricetes sp.]